VDEFPDEIRALCQPGGMGLSLSKDENLRGPGGYLGIYSIAVARVGPEMFFKHGGEVGRTLTVKVPVAGIRGCEIDVGRSREFARLAAKIVTGWIKRGYTVQYPLICHDDPLYLVPILKGGVLDSILRFWWVKEEVLIAWIYDGPRHHPMPGAAVAAIRDKSRWLPADVPLQ